MNSLEKQVGALRTAVERYNGERRKVVKEIQTIRKTLKNLKESLVIHEEAREIIRLVGLQTQEVLQYHISDITSLAMEAVFPDPYKLEISFVKRRNKLECDIMFSRDGKAIDPLESSGGGAVDVASFALRVASWSLRNPKKRNVIILDEPFRFLSAKYQPAASRMLKEISEKLQIQFIIVTHEEILAQYADKVFTVEIKDEKSIIT